jgi:DNA-binding protein HU-beta
MAGKQAAAKATPAQVSKAQAAKKSPASAQTALTKPSASNPAVAQPAKPAAVATITLKQLAAEVAEHEQIAKREAETIVTGLVGLLVDHLKSGDRLRIGGLGILEVKDRPERTGRNPATGEAITIKASKKIAFRPAKELKEAI